MGAVVLIITLALLALQARPDLSTDSDAVTDFDGLDLVANLDGVANNLVSDADWL